MVRPHQIGAEVDGPTTGDQRLVKGAFGAGFPYARLSAEQDSDGMRLGCGARQEFGNDALSEDPLMNVRGKPVAVGHGDV